MGASYGKKKSYSINTEPQPRKKCVRNGKQQNGQASAHAALQWEGEQEAQSSLRHPPADGFVPQPDYMDDEDDQDLIKPRKLVNPVKSSKSHQDMHKELLMRGGGGAEPKPELQRVLEARKREQRGRQKRQEEEARRKVSPLEQELLKRQKKLEELERQQEKDQEDMEKAPEFVKVKEKLRRTSFHSKDEKEV